MKQSCLYIILCLSSLLLLVSCRDEETVQQAEGKRAVTIDLGIAMSRAVIGSDIGDGSQPDNMQVWIFDQTNVNRLFYEDIPTPTFSGSDVLGELVNTLERTVMLEDEVTALNLYVVMNSKTLQQKLTATSLPDDIKAATFTRDEWTGDNQVPIYGEYVDFDVSEHKVGSIN